MDQQIKERMVGAGVLVLAAVIFIPMLLSGPPQQRAELPPGLDGEATGSPNTGSTQTADESGFSSRIVPLNAPSSGQSALAQTPQESVRESSPVPVVEKPTVKPPAIRSPGVSAAAKPTPKAAPKPAAKTTVRKAIAAPSATDGWVVQLGSFSNSRNAHALRDRLKAKGYKAFARSSGSGAQAVTRVYVGPDASREQAQQRVSRLLAETRLKGIVIRDPE